MRQHKLALCKPHYLEWFIEQTERFIKKYKMFTRDERVLVAVSGGKDSLALWDVLLKLGYQADGFLWRKHSRSSPTLAAWAWQTVLGVWAHQAP